MHTGGPTHQMPAAEGWPRSPMAAVAPWAASLTIEAGVLHLIACQDHFREWWGYGLFFLLVAVCQVAGGALLLIRCSERLCWAGIAGTSVVIAVWAVSRTWGVPIGPEGGGQEPIGLLDALSVAVECAAIVSLVRILVRPGASRLGLFR